MALLQRLPGRPIQSAALLPFVAITFAITWGLISFYIFFPKLAVSMFGEISSSHPFFFLATWGPAFAAFILVAICGGWAGIKLFLSRLLLWRCSLVWATLVMIGLPLVFVAGSVIKGGPVLAPLPPEGVGPMITVLFIMLSLGPIEELGWRGVAQPLLQRQMAPIWAGLIVGMVWGLWHLPAFYLSGTVQSGWNFTPFFIGNITLAVLVTPLFNNARGSLLWPMLFHWQLINPFWPDAEPHDTWILVAVSVVVVWLNRATMFSRDGAVTRVIPGTNEGRR
ncbi:CPBP family glutamic-type intramembrane protease [Sulfitobacter sp. MF3-043]|uniref:CPBP family glutamic-type intramembrane protease n=1 Tax=Sulfitobacter sediminivivens TaxID=3252902 RepID=UPI0036D82BFE